MTNRIKELRLLLSKQNLDAALISDCYDITYLTGYGNFSPDEREGFLLITKEENFVITDARYSEAVTKQVKNFELLERSPNRSLVNILKDLTKKYEIQKLGINTDNITVSEYKILKPIFKKLMPFSVDDLRMQKNKDEIAAITKACKIGDKAFSYIVNKLKPGLTEKEIAFELEYFIKKEDAGLSFPTIVAFGANSSIPHHQTGNTRLKQNDFALFDFGVKYDNYCSDMTRTIIFGKASDKQKKIHATVLASQQKAIDFLDSRFKIHDSRKKSVKASDVDKVARDHIVKQGYPAIPHSLGHGIGVEVHEPPRLGPNSKEILNEGMVFSIEPGIYIPGFGGVRIEDLFAIQNGKLTQLTNSPKHL